MRIIVDQEPYKDEKTGRVECMFHMTSRIDGSTACSLQPRVLSGGITFDKCLCYNRGCPLLKCKEVGIFGTEF